MLTPATFLALGDSYTIGEGVAPAERWPAQVVARLRAEGVAIGDPQIVAATGWTTGELSAAMDAAAFAPPYALVTLLIGVNDQYRGRPLDAYREGFRALLARAVALAGGLSRRVVAVSVPDWGVTPFAPARGRDARVVASAIDAFNKAACAAAAAVGAHWVDVTVISRQSVVRAELAADGLHPSGVQYAHWVEAILPVARIVVRAG